MNRRVPLRRRPLDAAIAVFFLVNLVFISYFVDLEQVVIPDTSHFTYPVWPPRFLVDAAHRYGATVDPLVDARPVWWRVTIWMDVLLFGPYYAVAAYALLRSRSWIRIPSIMWATAMLTNVAIILSEEAWGAHATRHLGAVVASNAAWIVFPLAVLGRMWKEPF